MRRIRDWGWLLSVTCLCLLMAMLPGAASGQDDSVDVTIAPGEADAAGEEMSATGAITPNVADSTNEASPPVPKAGTATSENSGTVTQPSSAAAGNAAAGSRSGPDTGRAGVNAAEGGRASDSPESLFSADDLSDLLPDIAQEQPGEIDTTPGELLTQPDRIPGFNSPLGPSRVPGEPVPDYLQNVQGNPGYQLSTNFGRIIVPTGSITGSTLTKQFHIEGGLILYYQNVTITAQTADIDEKNELAFLKGEVLIQDPKYELSTDEVRIRFEDKTFQATGYVQFKKLTDPARSQPNLSLPKKQRLREYFGGQQFELYCMDLHYNWSTKKLVALDSVRLVHPSFSGTMDRVDYDDKSKNYIIDGQVKLDVTDYNWVFQNKLVEPADEKRVRAVTNQPTHIECDRLIYAEDTGLAQFYALPGNQTLFDQTERKIHGTYMEVNDQTKDFHVEGTDASPILYEQTSGEWLFAGGIIKREDATQDLKDTLAKPLTANAQRLTYNFDRKRLELDGHVAIASGEKLLQAESVTQDQTAEFFLLHGNVLIQPDADSKIYAAQVYLDTQNDIVSFVGRVQGQLKNADLQTQAAESAATTEVTAPSGLFQTGQLPAPGQDSSGTNIAIQ
jgi:lipopolysaccharide export system protein LptA